MLVYLRLLCIYTFSNGIPASVTVSRGITENNAILGLSTSYNPETILRDNEVITGIFKTAIIESRETSHVYRIIKEVRRLHLEPPQVTLPTIAYQERVLNENWLTDDSI